MSEKKDNADQEYGMRITIHCRSEEEANRFMAEHEAKKKNATTGLEFEDKADKMFKDVTAHVNKRLTQKD